MKRCIFALLMLSTLMAMMIFVAPGLAADAPSAERSFDGKVLATMELGATPEEIKYFFTDMLGIPIQDFVTFPTATEALLALKAGKIDTLLSTDSTAKYMAQQDDTLMTYMDPRLTALNEISLSMVVLGSNAALGEELNQAIAQLKEDGIITKLEDALFGGEAPSAPEAVNSGRTLRVGVTGDIPPIDYVDMAGNPSGYNVSLMGHIGEKMQANVEFVSVSRAASATALATGRIDIIFWQEQSLSEDIEAMVGPLSSLVFATDPYLTLAVTAIELK